MIDWSKPKFQTKSGKPVEFLTYTGRGKYCLVGYIRDNDYTSAWDIKGAPFFYDGEALENVPEQTEDQT